MIRDPDLNWRHAKKDWRKTDGWTLIGDSSLVKVKGIEPNDPLQAPCELHVGGYFTKRSALINKNPEQIRVALGLPFHSVDRGVRIYTFSRIPQVTEYEYQLTTRYPGGLFKTILSDERYPEGVGFVHQWELKSEILIPARFLLQLAPEESFPNDLWLRHRI